MVYLERTVQVVLIEAELGQLQLGISGLGVAKGVESCEEMPEITVCINQSNDGRLRAGACGRRSCTSDAQLEALEEQPPAVVHGGRVVAPALVGGFKNIEVPARGEG